MIALALIVQLILSAAHATAEADGVAMDHRGALRVPPGRGNLEIQYTGLSFVEPESARFGYMLHGYDADWIEAGARRTAYYANVSPGEYSFRVAACNNDGVWSERDATLALAFLPHSYETAWFLTTCGVTLIAITAHGIGTRSIRAKSAALQAEVAERQRAEQKFLDLLECAPDAIAITLGIVQDHDGVLENETERGKGCKIEIVLPGIDADSVVHSHDPTPAQDSGQGEFILFLSEQAVERAIITAMLQSCGYEVVPAATEEPFPDQFESLGKRIRLLLIDLHQFGDDRLACLRHLRDNEAVAAAIVVTGNGELQLEAPLKFNTTTLHKPFQMTGIERLVATCVQQSCAPEEER